MTHPAIHESDHCVVDYVHVGPEGNRFVEWFIGDDHESYDAPTWPTREAMIADLEAAIVALRAQW